MKRDAHLSFPLSVLDLRQNEAVGERYVARHGGKDSFCCCLYIAVHRSPVYRFVEGDSSVDVSLL
jgi:hypothetical protein